MTNARTKIKMLKLKRAYEPVSRKDGKRFLVERLWPRGVRKASLQLDAWLKDVAPSTELRQWFAMIRTNGPNFGNVTEPNSNDIPKYAIRSYRPWLVAQSHLFTAFMMLSTTTRSL